MSREDHKVHTLKKDSNADLGWIFDPTTKSFVPPNEKKEINYKIGDSKYSFKCMTKEDIESDSQYQRKYKDFQWYKDMLESAEKGKVHVKGRVEIVKTASEAEIYETGPDIAITIARNEYIHFLILCSVPICLEKNSKAQLIDYLNNVVQDKTHDLPSFLTQKNSTVILYDRNVKKQPQKTKNINHIFKEGCRILSETQFDNAESWFAYTIKEDLKKAILKERSTPESMSSTQQCAIVGESVRYDLQKTGDKSTSPNQKISETIPKIDESISTDIEKIIGNTVTNIDSEIDSEKKIENEENNLDLIPCSTQITSDSSTVLKPNDKGDSTNIDNGIGNDANKIDSEHEEKDLDSEENREKKETYITSESFRVLKPTDKGDGNFGINRLYYFDDSQIKEDKIILLLGATGSGKTTLLNFFANYFDGVKSPQDKMVHLNSKFTNIYQPSTKEIIAHSFCSKKEPDISWTFIDTPGFDDSPGSENETHINSLKAVLVHMNANNMKLHAVGFVVQAHLVRLTASESLVMDYISTYFGEKAKDNIITFVTFADNKDSPPVFEAVKKCGLNSIEFLKFNNSILSADKYKLQNLDEANWRKGYKSLKKGMKKIKEMDPICPMNDLESKILNFTNIVQGNDRRKIKEVGQQVWEVATTFFSEQVQFDTKNTSVEDLVVETCKKVSIETKGCLKHLTFAPNRGMIPAVLAIIKDFNIVYLDLVKSSNQGRNNGNVCERCRKSLELRDDLVLKYCMTYYCSQYKLLKSCKAEINETKKIPRERLLDQVLTFLFLTMKIHMLPGVNIPDIELLEFLKDEVHTSEKQFINDLLQKKVHN